MSNEVYPFELGDFHCAVVSDGMMTYAPPMFPPPAMFLCATAPQGRLAEAQNPEAAEIRGLDRWVSSYSCLLIDTGKQKVLVDTGAGGLAPTTGKLIPNLRGAGVIPEEIGLVVITHAHPDHVGGAIGADSKPSFPKARYMISRKEWEFWTSQQAEQGLAEHGRDMLIGIARKSLLCLKDRIDLLDNDKEIIPGTRALAAPGHTPGQIALDISSRGQRLLYSSDVVLHPVHLIEPEWCAAVDVAVAEVATTRRRILSKAVAEKALVMAFHFPFPGLGHIEGRGATWSWKPI